MPVPEDDEEISYLALERGTPVVSSSGNEFGKVEHVLQVPELDLFDGVVVRVHHLGRQSHRFIDRDQIDKITRHRVRTLLTDEQAANPACPYGDSYRSAGRARASRVVLQLHLRSQVRAGALAPDQLAPLGVPIRHRYRAKSCPAEAASTSAP